MTTTATSPIPVQSRVAPPSPSTASAGASATPSPSTTSALAIDAGRDRRPARAQRRRQDHRDRHHARAARAVERPRRARSGMAPRDAVRSGRVGAMLQSAGLPPGARVGELVDLARGAVPGALAPRRDPRAGRPGGARRPARRDPVGRRGAAGPVRVRDRRRPRPRVPRRADRRDGRREPAGVLGGHAPVRRRGSHGAVRDPLPRRGRPHRRPDRGPGPRPDRRRRVAGRAARPRSPNAPSGSPCPTAERRATRRSPALPGRARRRRGTATSLSLLTADADATVRALVAAGVAFRHLEVAGADLDAAFLALTSGGGRDAPRRRPLTHVDRRIGPNPGDPDARHPHRGRLGAARPRPVPRLPPPRGPARRSATGATSCSPIVFPVMLYVLYTAVLPADGDPATIDGLPWPCTSSSRWPPTARSARR